MDKQWTRHVTRKITFGGRAVAVDFSFRTGFQLRVINCYMPSENNESRQEMTAIGEWLKHEYRTAQQTGFSIVWMGDFNGVMNQQLDRKGAESRSTTPETDIEMDCNPSIVRLLPFHQANCKRVHIQGH